MQVTVKGFGHAEDVSSEQHARSMAKYIEGIILSDIYVRNMTDVKVEPILEIIDAS